MSLTTKSSNSQRLLNTLTFLFILSVLVGFALPLVSIFDTARSSEIWNPNTTVSFHFSASLVPETYLFRIVVIPQVTFIPQFSVYNASLEVESDNYKTFQIQPWQIQCESAIGTHFSCKPIQIFSLPLPPDDKYSFTLTPRVSLPNIAFRVVYKFQEPLFLVLAQLFFLCFSCAILLTIVFKVRNKIFNSETILLVIVGISFCIYSVQFYLLSFSSVYLYLLKFLELFSFLFLLLHWSISMRTWVSYILAPMSFAIFIMMALRLPLEVPFYSYVSTSPVISDNSIGVDLKLLILLVQSLYIVIIIFFSLSLLSQLLVPMQSTTPRSKSILWSRPQFVIINTVTVIVLGLYFIQQYSLGYFYSLSNIFSRNILIGYYVVQTLFFASNSIREDETKHTPMVPINSFL
ncbi:hypothetical protein GEMRC1_002546 [Eukaryota sp. GEM-RC1]